jgi:beta-fructofuranosidase
VKDYEQVGGRIAVLGQAVNVSWQGMAGLPRTITLLDSSTDNNSSSGLAPFLLTYPIKEVESLRRNKTSVAKIRPKIYPVAIVNNGLTPMLDVDAAFVLPALADKSSIVATVTLSYGKATLELTLSTNSTAGTLKVIGGDSEDPSAFPLLPTDKHLELRVLVDHSIVEIFVQGGRIAHTARLYGKPNTAVTVTASGNAEVVKFDVFALATPTLDKELEQLARAAFAHGAL